MAAVCVRTATWSSVWISVLLLLILLQMLISLQLFAGVFVHSDEVLISPLFFCRTPEPGELPCISWSRIHLDGSGSGMSVLQTLVVLSFYVPVVLVAFGLLAMLLAAYSKDEAARWWSLACQAASSLLTLAGIVLFLVLYQSYVSRKDVTVWFYVCVGVQVELLVTSVLTYASRRKSEPDLV